MVKITFRQQQILDFICTFYAAKGYTPTIRQLMAHFHIASTNGVSDHLKALIKKGFLEKTARGTMPVMTRSPADDVYVAPVVLPDPSVEARLDRIEKLLEKVFLALSKGVCVDPYPPPKPPMWTFEVLNPDGKWSTPLNVDYETREAVEWHARQYVQDTKMKYRLLAVSFISTGAL